MKLFATTLLLLLFSIAFAQLPFEGKIRYTVTAYEKDGNGEITIYFGKPGIRLELMEAKKPEKDHEIIIINFDSGSILTLHPGKTYRSSPLRKKAERPIETSRQIAGYQTTPLTTQETPRDLAGLIGSSVLYLAADLTYPVPDVYSPNPQLIMVNQGKIVLSGDFYFPDNSTSDWPTDRAKDSSLQHQKLFSVIASEVVRQSVDPTLFAAPSDYTKESSDYSTEPYLNSLDTANVLRSEPAKKKKKKSTKNPLGSMKQKGTLRKND